MEPLVNLKDLLQHEIDDLYSAEEQIIEALPKMVENATDRELKKALNEHLRITREQKNRLDKVRGLLKVEEERKGWLEKIFGGSKCKGTEGLISEGEKMMGEEMDPNVKDAAIIASAQKIEHYEISGYGTARAYARQLGLTQVANLLETTLNEEYKSDDMLTSLALNKVNLEAEAPGGRPSGTKETTNGNGASGGSRGGRKVQRSAPKKAGAKSSKKAAAKKTASKKSSGRGGSSSGRGGSSKKSASKKSRR
jgi:ferritin-like metal-binding protein YciE